MSTFVTENFEDVPRPLVPSNEQEQADPPDAAWVTSAFADKGSMYFLKVNGHVYPRVVYAGDETTVNRLNTYCEGTVTPGNRSHQYLLMGQKAVRFAQLIDEQALELASANDADFLRSIRGWNEMGRETRRAVAELHQEKVTLRERQLFVDREAYATKYALWFAGYFGAGGSMQYAKGTPVLEIHSTHAVDIERFITHFAIFSPTYLTQHIPRQTYKDTRTYRAAMYAESAALITAAMEPLLPPSRQEFCQAVAAYLEGRRQALHIPTPSRPRAGSSLPYSKRIQEPQYMAGVLCARGSYYFREGSRDREFAARYYPVAAITSKNKALIDAIHAVHGSTEPVASQAHASYRTVLNTNVLLRVYQSVKPFLFLRRERATAILEEGEQQLTTTLLTVLAESQNKLPLLELQRAVIGRIGVPMLIQNPVIARLIDEGRIAAASVEDGLSFNVMHPANAPVTFYTPAALMEFLKAGLRQNLVISALGEIVATGMTYDAYTWYAETRPVPHARSLLSRADKSHDTFAQIRDRGRTLNHFRRVDAIHGYRELRAIEACIEMAVQRAFNHVLELYGDRQDIPLPNETPEEIAHRLVAEARRRE